MPHQCYTSALRSRTEKSHFDLPVLEIVRIVLDGLPRQGTDGLLVIMQVCQVDMEICIDLDHPLVAHL